MSLSNHASTFCHTEFDSYLTVNHDIQIHLIGRRNKKKLLRKIQGISSDL